MPHVTALICTRNRPQKIERAVRSLLDAGHDIELIVIDQSPGRETEQILACWSSDARFRYHRTTTIGKGAGLNVGLRMAKGSVVVLTDDDCEAPRDWASDMARILDAQADVAVLFCNVTAVPHDRAAGYVPTHERSGSRRLKSLSGLRHGLGLGAGMAIRRETALELGGFDESFGPGARFPSADEWDLSIRVLLLSNLHVLETSELAIVHDGFRSFDEGREHARRDWLALGAVCAKPLRTGHLRDAYGPLSFFCTRALLPPLLDLVKYQRPRGLGRITSFLRGIADGIRTPMDPKTMCFRANVSKKA